ncbi:MAG: 50S ribosomal protein L27, partial [Lewinellaceae bacterium]|nr:50S ribosomal protein L27 [Lewinellaceae bacterium]
KKATLQQILEAAGPRYKMHDPATWANQAKLAAKGEWDKLAKLQDELKGGKKS